MNFSWQIERPLDAIIFDCDGTLSSIEGIDELAEQNGAGDVVKSLTSLAMSSTGVTQNLYDERLRLVKPERKQIEALGDTYYHRRVDEIDAVIDVLQRLGKKIFIVSAGVQLAVEIFAKRLNIPASNVYAVDLYFDASGSYRGFDTASPLTHPGGKGQLVQRIKQAFPHLMYVGDGINDIDTRPYVERFVGYGGIFYRESIMSRSDFYIECVSMAPLLALALTTSEVKQLSQSDNILYDKGLTLITHAAVKDCR